MTNAVLSLAILKVNWDQLKRDYIEIFVPLIVYLIHKRKLSEIDVNKICSIFSDEWGLTIPYYPMVTILNRVKKRGFIRKRMNSWFPVENKILGSNYINISSAQLRKHEKVISEFIKFCEAEYGEKLSKEESNLALISFLKAYDLDILFACHQQTILPDVKASKKHKFLISSFIKKSSQSEPEVFQYIADIAIGHILANALLFDDFSKFQGKLKGTCLYFDTSFIFSLIGLAGSDRYKVVSDFIKTLSGLGSNLFIFRHTYEETKGILETCLQWIGKSGYDPLKASAALNYCVQSNFKSSDVERLIVNLDSKLEEYNIVVQETPDPTSNSEYQIDEKELSDKIISNYKSINPAFDESDKSLTIEYDVKSISRIYKLRKGRQPKNIKEARHIFVTANSALAYASKKFEDTIEDSFTIPACLTDVLLGTLIWLQLPHKMERINEKKLIADCYAAMQPDNTIIGKYLKELEKLRNEGKTNENEYYLLRTSRVARELLAEKTMGDPKNVFEKTPQEILQEIKREETAKYKKMEEALLQAKDRLEGIQISKNEIQERIEKVAEWVARISTILVFVFLVPAVLLALYFKHIPTSPGVNSSIKTFFVIILVALNFISFVFGINILGIANSARRLIRAKVIQILSGKET